MEQKDKLTDEVKTGRIIKAVQETKQQTTN